MAFNTLVRQGASAAGDYEIARSLKFIRADAHKLNRTPSSATNRKTYTFSCWVKLSARTGYDKNGIIFNAGPGSSGNNFALRITDTGTIGIDYYGIGGYYSTGRLRDPSAWYHCVWRVDTTDSTAADRVKVYVNGGLFFNSQMSLAEDADTPINNNVEHTIGVYSYDQTHDYTFDGYLAEVHFIDGTALDASSFGETNIETGQWIPKKYAGSYGTNGFYLDFSDNSGTSDTTLGKDSSGNGNNWTPANVSVSAGAGNDSLIDTPTNNFCVANQLDKGAVDIDRGGMIVSRSSDTTNWELCHGTIGIPSSGKWYWEGTVNGDMDGVIMGVGRTNFNQSLDGENDPGHWYYNTAGYAGYNGSYSSDPAAVTAGQIVQVAFDRDNNKIWFGVNNTWGLYGGTPVTPTDPNANHTNIPEDVAPLIGCRSTGQVDLNFGQRPFEFTKPTGYKSLCTQNLPVPTIKDGTKYFNTILYEGNSTDARAITGVGFGPNLVWIKNRDDSDWHNIYDTVRGAGKRIAANSTSVESASTDHMDSIDADGFTLKDGDNTNQNNESYVAWNWKESATAGFDIVSYTGNGSGPRTISHGLGVKPEMIIIKNREQITNWITYHKDIGAEKFIYLNTDAIQMDDAAAWNDTEPTSSVFTVNADQMNNGDGDDIIAYLFASVEGYSKVGSYVGNGSTNGPFVYTGFRPTYVLLKRVETTPNAYWNVYDTARDTYNSGATADFKRLLVHDNGAEVTNHVNYTPPDIYSNGFKFRHGASDKNYDGQKFIYLAFGEASIKYANAR